MQSKTQDKRKVCAKAIPEGTRITDCRDPLAKENRGLSRKARNTDMVRQGLLWDGTWKTGWKKVNVFLWLEGNRQIKESEKKQSEKNLFKEHKPGNFLHEFLFNCTISVISGNISKIKIKTSILPGMGSAISWSTEQSSNSSSRLKWTIFSECTNQCSGSGSTGSTCFRTSRIQIHWSEVWIRIRSRVRILLSSNKNSTKNLHLFCDFFWTF